METLIRHFRDLTKAAFARHGFAYAELVAQWPAVVGGDLAAHCEPERIRWPRGQGEGTRKLGGTLVIRAAAGRTLELQHETPRIVERINGFYGYGAIAGLRIVRDPISPSSRRKREPPVAPAEASGGGMDSGLGQDDDMSAPNGLEAALARLGRCVGLSPTGTRTLNSTPTSSIQDES